MYIILFNIYIMQNTLILHLLLNKYDTFDTPISSHINWAFPNFEIIPIFDIFEIFDIIDRPIGITSSVESTPVRQRPPLSP